MNQQTDKAAYGGLRTTGLFCPLGPMASAEYFGECLVRHNIVDAHALDDPEGYDGYQTIERIVEAYDEITQHLRARAEEALEKVKAVMDDIHSRQNVRCSCEADFSGRSRGALPPKHVTTCSASFSRGCKV